jgi:tetratricopeptide (TPR) repeat protein
VLGYALAMKGARQEAITAFRAALRLDPNFAEVHRKLGWVLTEERDLAQALIHCRKAVALVPKNAQARNTLAVALKESGKLDDALVQCRTAVELAPKLAECQCQLGLVLQSKGRFAQAVEALKRGHALGSRRPDWPFPSGQWLGECERLAALNARLAAVQGGEEPRNPAEQSDLACFCATHKQQYHRAARWYSAAFEARPELVEEPGDARRYHAACAAALAASGRGEDAAGLDDKERARWRKQALDWLRTDLALWSGHLEKKPGTGAAVDRVLQGWQRIAALASLRDEVALANLPGTEREAFRKLWADVKALRKRAGAPEPSGQPRPSKR